ncbi:LptF/LptG family permease [Pelagibacterium montanilacus]|uniref:LptF/LptG family permease n=1 Tax=Pelagibacterium montanilacus TaxID=2185280 RepID=UPI000F8CB764|nr:LptF/LptG family permease [Pelagibacterium montanilacus]
MDRLARYLQRQFFAQALAIFLAGGALIWLMQLLRLFDLVSAQGQNFFTLMGQSALTTPTFARSILYVCFAIGLVRGLKGLQASRELHTIHAAQRTRALWQAVALFTLAGTISVTAIANWVEPNARRISTAWSAEIAADVVGRAMVPGRYSEIGDGLVFAIENRLNDGTLVGFFFDDTTNADSRRTYFADTARVFVDETGYQLILNDGAVQYESPGRGGLSQIRFAQYHISLASLMEAATPSGGRDQMDSLALLNRILAGESDAEAARDVLVHRLADSLRTLAICLLAVAMCGFPHGARTGGKFPVELVILVVAFGEQAFATFSGGGMMHLVSPTIVLLCGTALLARRLVRADIMPSRFARRSL